MSAAARMLIFGQSLRDRSDVSASISLTELKNHLVMQVLRMQCCKLAGQCEQLRAAVKVSRQLSATQGSRIRIENGRAGALGAGNHVLRQPDKAAQISVDLPLVLPIVKTPLVLMVKVTRPT